MILDETLLHLQARGAVTGRSLSGVYLNSYFTVVELDDGSVGAGMSYYAWPAPQTQSIQEQLAALRAADPLLVGWLFHDEAPARHLPLPPDQAALLVGSLRTAVVSALSAPSLRAGGDETFAASNTRPFDPFAGAASALVIGFGGYMRTLVHAAPQIRTLHLSDLSYGRHPKKMDAIAEPWRRDHPEKRIILSDGRDTPQRLREVDVVAITGSALCNGTLETLLDQARGGPRVVVQGQSASIHPVALFSRGVQFVATTLKPPELARPAAADPSGSALSSLLSQQPEDDALLATADPFCPALRPHVAAVLPQVYCTPRTELNS